MNDMKKLDTEEIGNAMFDAFMKADLDTVKAMVQSEPELVSETFVHEEIGNAMFDAFMKADLDTVKAMVQSEPELVSKTFVYR